MMMSECRVANWNQRQQRQERLVEGEEGNRSPHVQSDQNLPYVVPMCDYDEVREVRWENGQVAMNGLGTGNIDGLQTSSKQTWGLKAGDTLESIVHQATFFPQVQVHDDDDDDEEEEEGVKCRIISSIPTSSSCGGKYGEDSSPGLMVKKRVRECYEGDNEATDTTMMTWPSFESPPISSQHASENQQDEERLTKGESFRSQSSARSSRAAAVHNQSERRRRDRINEKMKALQKLVPNASKTDKASMLDEVIEYLKQLQAQIRMMSNARNMMPQMVMPLGMQQQLQMSLLARMGMGMGMGMGMVDVNNFARNVPPTLCPLIHATAPLGGTTPSFVSPPFAMPPMVPPPTSLKPNTDAANTNTFVPNFNDAYKMLLAQQSMNMDFFNKVAALYRQQASNKPVRNSQPNNGQL